MNYMKLRWSVDFFLLIEIDLNRSLKLYSICIRLFIKRLRNP